MNSSTASIALLLGPLVVTLLANPAAGQAPPQQDQESPQFDRQTDLIERLETVEEELQGLRLSSERSDPGSHKLLISGFGSTTFTNAQGADSSFGAAFNPIFLYEMGERFLFETELEISSGGGMHGGGGSSFELGYAHGSYLVNDYLTVGAGKFLTPFGVFGERIHPAWINKLPTAPLTAGHSGIIPMASVGAYFRGGFSTGPSKWNYALYVSNGPRLNDGEDEPDEAGMLHFDNYSDVNNSKALGLRVGYLPVPRLELGVSYLTSSVTASMSDLEKADAGILGFDLSHDIVLGAGRLALRAEWALSQVDDVVYDSDGSLGFGPLTFDNERSGGYLQLAYRPAGGEDILLTPWEFVARYETFDQPGGAPTSIDVERLMLGVDYWLSPTNVLKLAYAFDNKDGGTDQDAVYLQFAFGF